MTGCPAPRRRLVVVLLAALLAAGCSDDGDPGTSGTGMASGAGAGSSTDEPLQPAQPTLPAEPEMVEPRADLEDVQVHPWDEVFVVNDGRGIELRWTAEPCRHLHHIDVEPRDEVVVLTLHLGRDPAEDCEGRAYRARRRGLPEPVGTRSLADGAEL